MGKKDKKNGKSKDKSIKSDLQKAGKGKDKDRGVKLDRSAIGGGGPIKQTVPTKIHLDELKVPDVKKDKKFVSELVQGKPEAVLDQLKHPPKLTEKDFLITPEEKIDAEFPGENEEVLVVNEEDILAERLSYLQRRLQFYKVPVMIILEGAYASGKGRVANELLLGLDVRYTKFYATKDPNEEELKRPFLSQYFHAIPKNDQFAIFYRSWYSLYIYYKNRKINREVYKNPEILINEMKAFEKSLADNGYVIIKFKIKIDGKKQDEHIKKMMDNPLTTWVAQVFDKANDEEYVREMEKLMKVTDEPYAPWYIQEYTTKSETTTEVLKKVISILDKKLDELENAPELTPLDKDGSFTGDTRGILNEIDMSKDVSDQDYSLRLKDLQQKMREVQYALYTERIPMILVFEGWDAAGKGGSIQRIIAKLDPTNYTVNTTSAPNSIEFNHHYLWRFAKELPKTGHIAIWDRSWYGRVMVERVEGFATNQEWSRAYYEINDFEKLMTNYGAIVLKFFVNIDKDTQLARFTARQKNPAKSWKITDEDWRNRDKWDKYTEAIHDMVEKTSTKAAPWIMVEGNSKKYARLKILQTIIAEADKRLKLINYSGTGEIGQALPKPKDPGKS